MKIQKGGKKKENKLKSLKVKKSIMMFATKSKKFI